MASNAKAGANPWQRIPSHLRDALTGSPLVATSRRVALRTIDGSPARPKDIPYKLHTSRMVTVERQDDPSYHIGHQAWTRLFEAYMADIVPSEAQEAERLWYCWYREPYLVGRALAHYTPQIAVYAVLARYRDNWPVMRIFQEFHRSLAWIDRHYRKMTAFVRFHYLLDERQRLIAYRDAGTLARRPYAE